MWCARLLIDAMVMHIAIRHYCAAAFQVAQSALLRSVRLYFIVSCGQFSNGKREKKRENFF